VTFDDGHISNYENAAPLLEKHQLSGIFFVAADFIGKRLDCMDWHQLRQLSQMGHEIQSHSSSHPMLTQCTKGELLDELIRSKATIEDRLGTEVSALSVPGGRWNSRVLEAAAHVGYRRVFISNPWIHRQHYYGVELVGRLTIKAGVDSDQLRSLLTGKGFYAARFRASFEFKEMVRILIGETRYRHFWNLLSKASAKGLGKKGSETNNS
jgi:peptidoglycan/xylan/chitin deacetylase (PgdA/CDA1 family)